MCLIGSASYNNGQLSDPKYGHQLIGNAHIVATVLKELRVTPQKNLYPHSIITRLSSMSTNRRIVNPS